ncbi:MULTISPECIES: CopD family protein [Sphingosinicellaceae]|uniref:CopD family protein n=1 Tax=Sphingosinicellaceae TaxID=2820280 RepID=UPI001C1DDCA0|nr:MULTISPECIES: CopD family protein [Polymorphobacter]QYE35721.1 CopD family protein [Polymorphobacter sp. PAMC 29334]UAJ10913.1 CopD family protein [Polymorphobacter megasporae]
MDVGSTAYLWVKALHVIAVIFWMAGLFMLPRFLIYHMESAVGSPEDAAWIDRERRLKRIILTPGLIAVWILGITLAVSYGLAGQGWLHTKIFLVVLLSGYHGWASATASKFARGVRPYRNKTLRLLNEVPALATIAIVILVVVKPF